MKIYKLSFLLSTFVIISISYASITRTRTMGDVGIILRDDANYWIFPSTICYNKNIVSFELGGSSELLTYFPAGYGFNKSASGVISAGKSGNIKIGAGWSEMVSRNPFLTYASGGGTTDSRFDLFYGKATKDEAFGVHLERHADLMSTSATPGSDSRISITRHRLEMGKSTPQTDMTVGYQLSNYYNKTKGSTSKTIYNHCLNLGYRKFNNIRESLTMTPFIVTQLEFEFNNISDTDAGAAEVWAGIGLNHSIDENNLIVGALSVRGSYTLLTADGQDKTSISLDLPFVFGGIESEPLSWLFLRVGFQKTVQRTININKNNNVKSKSVATQAPYGLTCGIGLEYKRLKMDFSYDFNNLRKGLYLLSGKESNLCNLISIEYQM